MKKKYLFLLIVIFQLLFSCTNTKYEGFSDLESGIYYKLHRVGEINAQSEASEVLTVDLTYQTMRDSVFFKGRRKIVLSASNFYGSIDECFAKLTLGDSATFIINANDFFNKTIGVEMPKFIGNSNKMKVSIDVLEIKSQHKFLQEKKEFLSWIKDFGEYEQVVLEYFIDKEQVDITPGNPEIFYRRINEGNNKVVEIGDTVVIHYEGRFLNGDFFDSTIEREQPFEFVYGTEWQVIIGIEKALKQMREGEKSLFVFPSNYAFGYKGSSTGLIPPFTSVVFEIELIQLRKAN